MRLSREGGLLASGMQLGICQATLEHATDYALKREQFNRPIGSLQAIKHFLAAMLVRMEQASAAVYAPAATAARLGVRDLDRPLPIPQLLHAPRFIAPPAPGPLAQLRHHAQTAPQI